MDKRNKSTPQYKDDKQGKAKEQVQAAPPSTSKPSTDRKPKSGSVFSKR